MQYEEQDQCERSDQRAVNNSVLAARAARGFRVRNARESNHAVKRQINSRQRGFEEVIDLFFGAKCARGGFIAHLDKIFQGEIGQGVSVLFTALEIFRERALSIL